MQDSLSNISIASNAYTFSTKTNSQNSQYNLRSLLNKKRINNSISHCLNKKNYKDEDNMSVNSYIPISNENNSNYTNTKILIKIIDPNRTESDSDSCDEKVKKNKIIPLRMPQLEILKILNRIFKIRQNKNKNKLINEKKKIKIKIDLNKKKQKNILDNFNDRNFHGCIVDDDNKITMEELINCVPIKSVNELYSEIEMNHMDTNPFDIDFDVNKINSDKDVSEDESYLGSKAFFQNN